MMDYMHNNGNPNMMGNPNMGGMQQGGYPNVGGFRGYLANYRQTPPPMMGMSQGPKISRQSQPPMPHQMISQALMGRGREGMLPPGMTYPPPMPGGMNGQGMDIRMMLNNALSGGANWRG